MSHLPREISGAPSFPVSIHIAGDPHKAVTVCQRFCDEVGLCVTVKDALYVYTGGREPGVTVGLINYPRFPKTGFEITMLAIRLAYLLREELSQESFAVETPTDSMWFSWRNTE